MAESKHDDLADALARMAGGQEESHEPQEHSPVPPPPARAVRPMVKPASSRSTAPVTAPPTTATPSPAAPPPRQRAAAPVAPVTPVTPVVPGTPVAPVAPAPASVKPARPAAPVLATPVIRRDRPTAPTIRQSTAEPDVDGGQSTGLSSQVDQSQVVDDDDSVIVPAPDASVFNPKKKSITSAEARAKIQKKKRLEYRRTLIPILLTTGTLLLIFGVLKFLAGPDSQLANLPGWAPLVLLGVGAFLLVLAAINMLSVKQELTANAKG